MIRKILVATDFSDTAHQTLLFAFSIASRTNASITLLHVHKLEIIRGGFSFHKLKKLEEAKEKFYYEKTKNYLQEIRTNYKFAENVKTEIVIDFGSIIDSVLYHSEKSDLTMIGSHGTSKESLVEKILGSLPTNLIQTIEKPLLIFPKNKKFDENFNKFLYLASSKNPGESKAEFIRSLILNVSQEPFLYYYIFGATRNVKKTISSLQSSLGFPSKEVNSCTGSVCEQNLLDFIKLHKISFMIINFVAVKGILNLHIPKLSDRFYSELNIPLLILKNT